LEVGSFSYWFDKPWFHTEERLAAMLIIPSSWGFQLGGHLHAITYIDDKKIYPVIISSKISGKEEERLLEILRKHRGAVGYTLDDLKGIYPTICQHAINMEQMQS
jgi:hypothetical protein